MENIPVISGSDFNRKPNKRPRFFSCERKGESDVYNFLSRFRLLLNDQNSFYTEDYLRKNVDAWKVCELKSWLLDRAERHGIDIDRLQFAFFNVVDGRRLTACKQEDFQDFSYSVKQRLDTYVTSLYRELIYLEWKQNQAKDNIHSQDRQNIDLLEKIPVKIEERYEIENYKTSKEDNPKNPGMKKGRLKKESREEDDEKTPDPFLPQFLWRLLHDQACNPSVIKWVNRDLKIFKFVDTRRAAQLWGDRRAKAEADQDRNRKTMNYEKLTRALRYHYKSNAMLRNETRRVYQFGLTPEWFDSA